MPGFAATQPRRDGVTAWRNRGDRNRPVGDLGGRTCWSPSTLHVVGSGRRVPPKLGSTARDGCSQHILLPPGLRRSPLQGSIWLIPLRFQGLVQTQHLTAIGLV